MLERPCPEFGEGFRLCWGGGRKVVLLDGESREVDSVDLEKVTFFHASTQMRKFHQNLNKACQG